MHKPLLALAFLASLGFSGASMAVTTVSASRTLDVTAITPQSQTFFGAQDVPAFDALVPITLAAGDTLDFTVDFLGSQTLTLTNPSAFWALIYSTSGGNQQTSMTGSMSLLDSSGGVLFTSTPASSVEGDVHVGQYVFASQFAGLPSTVTFGGVRYQGTVDAYAPKVPGTDPVITTRDYSVPGFFIAGDSFVTSVPEPSAWMMMACGLAVLVVRSAQRKA